MAITNPEAIRFVNEQIRPLCEKARALNAEINSMQTLWFSGLNVSFPNTVEVLEDNRVSEGVSILTGANINSAVGILAAMTTASNAEIIAKPCVRAFTAQ
jgi:hypothetical protein